MGFWGWRHAARVASSPDSLALSVGDSPDYEREPGHEHQQRDAGENDEEQFLVGHTPAYGPEVKSLIGPGT